MPTLSTQNPTMLDVAKRLDPSGRIPVIAEMQSKVNPIMADMPMVECNDGTTHLGVIRTGLPPVAWRLLNYGVAPGKSKTKQVRDACGIMETWNEIDEEVFKLNGASSEFRMSEAKAQIEAMAIEHARVLFYGNQLTNPEQITGLAPRYSLTTAENGGQIISVTTSPSADLCTSMWLIAWGESTIHGIFPRGTVGGNEFRDLGEETSESSTGLLMRVLRSQFKLRTGLHLKDWQAVVRLANIDLKDATQIAASPLIDKMIQGYYKIPQRLRNTGRLAWYCNPLVKENLVKKAMTATTYSLTLSQYENGEAVLKFWGIPVRECDALINTEAVVS